MCGCWQPDYGMFALLRRSPMNLRRCLFLLVCLAGLPLKRASLIKGFLRLDSFVERRRNDGLSDFYLMVAILKRIAAWALFPYLFGKKSVRPAEKSSVS